MELGIRGKNALVTGASRGIGKGIAEALAAEGANLLLVARSQQRLTQHALDLSQSYGVKVVSLAADFSEPDAVPRILRAAGEAFDGIDILINISGGPKAGATMDLDGRQYTQQFDQMVAPLIELSRQLAKMMVSRQWGRIITVASSGVIQPIKDLALSNVLRSGLVSWNKSVAHELAPFGVTVNTLIPGRIQTERVNELDQARAKKTDKTLEQVIAESHATIPMNRYGSVKEFAAVATFLASQQAAYMTGSCIRVDGGMIASLF